MSRPRGQVRQRPAQVAGDSPYRDFLDRFGLGVNADQCAAWFATWIRNQLTGDEVFLGASEQAAFGLASRMGITYRPATAIMRMMRTSDRSHSSFEDYIPVGLHDLLRATEYLHANMPAARAAIDRFIPEGLANAPCDLQLRWEDGRFLPAGAELLDQQLVSPALAFLRNSALRGAAEPLERALRALLEGRRTPPRYKDAVRDAYEAVEYAAKIVCDNDRTLNANREFVGNRARLAGTSRALLREYIAFGNDYRHAESIEGLPPVDGHCAEQCIYETAILLRALQPALQSTIAADETTGGQ